MSVAWFHFTQSHSETLGNGFQVAIGEYGYLGVQIFFVISGMVIPIAVTKMTCGSPRHFLGRRLIRLTPPFWGALVTAVVLWQVSFLLGFAPTSPSLGWDVYMSNATYTAGILALPWVIPVFWSLAIELQFYILMLLFVRFGFNRRSINFTFLSVSVAAPFVVPSPTLVFHFLPFFALGMVVFLAIDKRMDTIVEGFWVIALAVSIELSSGTATSIAALAAYAYCRYGIGFTPKWLRGVGLVSYSLYLIHVPVGGRVMNLMSRLDHSSWLVFGPILALLSSILAAWLMFLLIEKPAIRWSRGI